MTNIAVIGPREAYLQFLLDLTPSALGPDTFYGHVTLPADVKTFDWDCVIMVGDPTSWNAAMLEAESWIQDHIYRKRGSSDENQRAVNLRTSRKSS